MGARLELAGSDGTIIDLLPAAAAAAGVDGYVQAMAGNTQIGGAPDMTVTELFSQVIDGAVEVVSQVGNTQFAIELRFTSTTDSSGLTDVEQQLSAVVDNAATLTYQHPDGVSPATVWGVQIAQLAPEFDDLNEIRLRRNWTLTLTCWPWPRSEALWTAKAIPVPPATIIDFPLDAPTTATGWTVLSNAIVGSAAASMDSSMVLAAIVGTNSTIGFVELKRTGSFALSTSPYIEVTGAFYDTVSALDFYVNGTHVAPVALNVSTSPISRAQSYTAFLPVPAGVTTLTTLSVRGHKRPGMNPNNTVTLKVWVDEIHRTNASPFGTDMRVQDRTVTIPGTKAAQAQVTVAATSSAGSPIALGPQVLLYTSSDPSLVSGYIAPFRASGPARTTDATMLSGASTTIGVGTGTEVYEIPISLLPAGTYILVGKLASATGKAVSTTFLVATPTDPQPVISSPASGQAVTFTAPATQQFVPLGAYTFPNTRVANPGAVNQTIQLSAWVGAPSIVLDTLFLFNIDEGQLSIVDTSRAVGSTADATTLIYTAPDGGDTPAYQLSMQDSSLGYLGDFDATPRASSWAVHQFAPGPCRILAVTTTAATFGAASNQLTVNVACYPRWAAYAGQVDS